MQRITGGEEVTNKEYLQSLTMEELVKSPYFSCPYGDIFIAAEEKKGNNICPNKDILRTLKSPEEIADYVFSGRQRSVCNDCKVKWLSEEKRK